MPPRMRIVEKKVTDEKCRAVRTPQRCLLERTPADEDAVRRGLDEGKVTGRHCSQFIPSVGGWFGRERGIKRKAKRSEHYAAPSCVFGEGRGCVAAARLNLILPPPNASSGTHRDRLKRQCPLAPTTPAPIRNESGRCSPRSPDAITAPTRCC